MFKESINENKIPPNFLNSILTNNSLYEMFKEDFDNNSEYFQNLNKEEYLRAMLKFIENTFFCSNIFHIYDEPENIDNITEGKLSYIRYFYDDFLLKEFELNPESILKTKLFRGLEYAKKHDLYAAQTKEFNSLYDYIFKESIDYYEIKNILIKEPLEQLKKRKKLSFQEFDILCNWIKNNINDTIDLDISIAFLYSHVYKINHIFDKEVAECLLRSIIKEYLSPYEMNIQIVFINGLDNGAISSHSIEENKIEIDSSIIENFLSLNYVELFEVAFYEAKILRDVYLLRKNNCDYETLRLLMNLIIHKVDLDRIYFDTNYKNTDYYLDFRASNFVNTLRFFSYSGINLFKNFINSKINELDMEEITEQNISKKEISLDQQFELIFSKIATKNDILKKYPVIRMIYDDKGHRKKTINIIKLMKDDKKNDFLVTYLHSRIIEPERIIEDVNDLSNYKTKDKFLKDFINDELKYIYADSFYYSLESFIKLKSHNLDLNEYLSSLIIKINCIKDTPLTHRFKDAAIMIIKDIQQNN